MERQYRPEPHNLGKNQRGKPQGGDLNQQHAFDHAQNVARSDFYEMTHGNRIADIPHTPIPNEEAQALLDHAKDEEWETPEYLTEVAEKRDKLDELAAKRTRAMGIQLPGIHRTAQQTGLFGGTRTESPNAAAVLERAGATDADLDKAIEGVTPPPTPHEGFLKKTLKKIISPRTAVLTATGAGLGVTGYAAMPEPARAAIRQDIHNAVPALFGADKNSKTIEVNQSSATAVATATESTPDVNKLTTAQRVNIWLTDNENDPEYQQLIKSGGLHAGLRQHISTDNAGNTLEVDGIQGYVLNNPSKDKDKEGNPIIVLGFQRVGQDNESHNYVVTFAISSSGDIYADSYWGTSATDALLASNVPLPTELKVSDKITLAYYLPPSPKINPHVPVQLYEADYAFAQWAKGVTKDKPSYIADKVGEPYNSPNDIEIDVMTPVNS